VLVFVEAKCDESKIMLLIYGKLSEQPGKTRVVFSCSCLLSTAGRQNAVKPYLHKLRRITAPHLMFYEGHSYNHRVLATPKRCGRCYTVILLRLLRDLNARCNTESVFLHQAGLILHLALHLALQ
jgi:hypothetical protein